MEKKTKNSCGCYSGGTGIPNNCQDMPGLVRFEKIKINLKNECFDEFDNYLGIGVWNGDMLTIESKQNE